MTVEYRYCHSTIMNKYYYNNNDDDDDGGCSGCGLE